MPESDGALKILIDRDVCMGSGVCLVYAPGTFAQDSEPKAVLVDPITDSVEQIRVAVEACPTGALSISTGEEGV
jgi:ferredoxin